MSEELDDRDISPTPRFVQKAFSMGEASFDLTKTMQKAAELEDEEILKRLTHSE